MLLITGCGRSGTQYIATVLLALGVDVGHEQLGRDGIVSSVWTVEDGSYPPFHCQGGQPAFDVVLHQVRHPLQVIGSVHTATAASWDFVCRHIPIGRSDPLLKRCAEYWLHWNRLAEQRAQWTYRIEALGQLWDEWRKYAGVDGEYETVAAIPRTINSRTHPAVTWSDVRAATPLYRDIEQMARRYGYGVD